MESFILIGYFGILVVLCVYGGHRLYITHLFKKRGQTGPRPERSFETPPRVTVQVPLYNEKFVVERIIDACAALRYPRDLLQIQILDDSTDETQGLARARVRYHRERGLNISYIHRENRAGYKAGALEHGLASAQGEFIAIFDADFVPGPDLLMQTIDSFTDPGIGMVQARWDHLNREDSTLTQVQAMMLDAHFIVEHGGRCAADLFFNFNGTAGIWRRRAIDEAGGWQHDTLTEDLDLSYRAQLAGWRFLFLPDVVCPAELPVSMPAFKSQQHRWAKGSIQVMKKLLPRIWRAPIPLKVKAEATFHLTGNLAYLLMVINSVFFLIPAMIVRGHQPWWQILLIDGPLFLMASFSFIHFYLTSQFAIFRSTRGRKRYIPALMAVGIGLGINNTRAVLEALLGRQSEFVRTPKRGRAQGKAVKAAYANTKVGGAYLELAAGFLYTIGIVWAIVAGVWASIPFLVLFQNGFYFLGGHSLWEALSHRRTAKRLPARRMEEAI